MRNREKWAEYRQSQRTAMQGERPARGRRVYIYTIPKAGTYLLAEIIARLGYTNTGYHVALDHCLDTQSTTLEQAARRPSETSIRQPYWKTLRTVPPGGLCFGHMNPMLFPPQFSDGFSVVACRRSLRAVLAAEYVDFRFRREDVRWLSIDAIADHKEAFLEYLRRNGPAIAGIAGAYIANRELRSAWYYTATRRLGSYVDVSFESLWENPLEPMRAMAEAVGKSLADDELMAIFEAATKAENKTKSVKESFPIRREELWTPEAEQIYQRLQFPRLGRLLGYPDVDRARPANGRGDA